jgi:hypothetical protein
MITNEKLSQALDAIHRILVVARFMAYKSEPTERIAKVLDYAEILPTLISADEDRTDEFRTQLKGFASEFSQGIGILQEFDQDKTMPTRRD